MRYWKKLSKGKNQNNKNSKKSGQNSRPKPDDIWGNRHFADLGDDSYSEDFLDADTREIYDMIQNNADISEVYKAITARNDISDLIFNSAQTEPAVTDTKKPDIAESSIQKSTQESELKVSQSPSNDVKKTTIVDKTQAKESKVTENIRSKNDNEAPQDVKSDKVDKDHATSDFYNTLYPKKGQKVIANEEIYSTDFGNSSTNSSKGAEKILKDKKDKYLLRATWFVSLVFVSAFLASYAIVGMNDMLGIGKSSETVAVEIPSGSNLTKVSQILKSRGIINQSGFFTFYAFATKNSRNFSGGSFELRPNMDYQVILNGLRSTEPSKEVIEIALREGMSILEYADLLDEKHVCSKNTFLERCKTGKFEDKYEFLKNLPNESERYYKLEGYLFPDTYEFYLNEGADAVISKLLKNFQRKAIKIGSLKGYSEQTSIKELAEKSGKSLDEIINLASLIQAEAANENDMYKISSIIRNRMSIPSPTSKNKFGEFGLTKLGIDSTVWYPYKTKISVPENIVNTFESRYDTYKIDYLPPGPICNPGMKAIYAALNPENTDYFYFCHSASGESYYARTNSAHIANLRKAGL